MGPHEIFLHLSPAMGDRLLSEIAEREKPLYKATIETLAKQRKLRPVFVERKPRAERHEWLRQIIGKKANEGVAAHLIQIWLVGGQQKMLCDFLDALGISHEDNGTVDDLPSAPPKEQLAPAVEGLLAKYDREAVALYLNAFQSFDDEGGWSTLGELIAEDPRLQLGSAASTAS